MKLCGKCNTTKSLSEFGKDRHTKDGLCYFCKPCRNARLREYNQKNPHIRAKINANHREYRKKHYSDPENKRKYKSDYLKQAFGITIEEFDQMLEKQQGVCAICSRPERGTRNKALAVDHCHETNKIRGLLCGHCNRAIGLLGDDINLLLSAIKYLEASK